MPRKTLRQQLAETQFALNVAQENYTVEARSNRRKDSDIHARDAHVSALTKEIEELKREKQWFKQLVQNYSEALNAHLRNR